MLYSKNGSIPKPQTDGTDGWVEVSEAPIAGEGQEVVWWCPPGWVVRPVKPVKDGFDHSWSQTEQKWVEFLVSAPEGITLPEVTTTITLDSTTASGTISV